MRTKTQAEAERSAKLLWGERAFAERKDGRCIVGETDQEGPAVFTTIYGMGRNFEQAFRAAWLSLN